MADNPYISPTLTNYNANPPSDDGSQTDSNEVQWSKHKDKLGDPLKTFSESQNDNTSAAFAKTINTDADQANAVAGSIAFTSSELTIATGSVAAVRSHHTIDTEADDATDDLDTITVAGVSDGALIMLRLANAARVVTLKHGVDNLNLKDGLDTVLEAGTPTFLLRVGANWEEVEKPNDDTKPAFLAFVSATITNVTGAGTLYKIIFDSENYNVGGNHSNGTFTATVAGLHVFQAGTQIAGLVSSTVALIDIVNTTTSDGYTLRRIQAPPDGTVGLGGSITMNLAVGDTVEIRVTVAGMAGDTADVNGDLAANFRSWWSGGLK